MLVRAVTRASAAAAAAARAAGTAAERGKGVKRGAATADKDRVQLYVHLKASQCCGSCLLLLLPSATTLRRLGSSPLPSCGVAA